MTARPANSIVTALPARRRQAKPKVTKASLDRVAEFLKGMGAKVGAVDVGPDMVRIITTDGQNLTLGDDEATLNKELAEHRAKHGHGAT